MNIQPPTALLQGYDSFMGQMRNTAASATTNSSGGITTNVISLCTDTEQVINAINVSAQVSAGFANASFSAAASFAQSLDITSTSVVLIVSTFTAKTTQATSAGLAVVPPADLQRFFDFYGDSYVNSICTGGQYYAAFIFDSVNSEEQQTITADLNGSTGIGKLNASLSAKIEETATKTGVSIRMDQQVLGVSNPSLPALDVDAIVAYALAFPTLNIDAPVVFGFELTGYEHLPGLTYDFGALVANRSLLGISFVDAAVALTMLSGQVGAIQSMYNSYHYNGDSILNRNAGVVAQDIADFATLVQKIESDVDSVNTPPPLRSLTFGTPLANFALNGDTIPIGDGTFFNDVSIPGVLQGAKPAAITLLAANAGPNTQVFGISTTYTDGNTYTHGGFGTVHATEGPMTIQPDDAIASMSVWSLPLVLGIEIQTANGLSVGGVFPPPPFPSHVSTTTAPPMIIGFTGYDLGPFLSTFSPVTITLAPAVWVNALSTPSPSLLRKPVSTQMQAKVAA